MINLIKLFLETNNYGQKSDDFEDSYLSHPNYPSLFAITDTFNLLQIENLAIKIPKEQFVELPKWFLTLIDDEFVLVNKNEKYINVNYNDGKKLRLGFNDFLSKWGQLVVAIEPNDKTVNPLSLNLAKWLLYCLPCVSLILLSIFSVNHNLDSIIILIASILGSVLGMFVIQEKIGINSGITSKICNFSSETSCNSVIKSSTSDFSEWLNFADLPILFFYANLFSVLIFGKFHTQIITILSICAVPFVLYSVWLQKIKIRKWCVLCLFISLIIVLQSALVFFVNSPFSLTGYEVSIYLIILIVVSIIWFGIRFFLYKNKSLNDDNLQLRRFRRNFSIFKSLLKVVKDEQKVNELDGIEFGNSNSKLKLSLFLSPSCIHCHSAFKESYELYQNYPDKFSFKVFFNLNPENKDNPFKVIVDCLLTINSYDRLKAQESIIDWHINKLNPEEWKEKWIVNIFDEKCNVKLLSHYNWCLQNNLNYTPVKIINQSLFPNEYDISELKYFIDDFSEKTNQ